MAYTVEAAFSEFFDKINLSGDHRETSNARKDRIVSLLSNHFEIMEAFATGSIPRFTALSGVADLDVMVALHWSKHIKDRTPASVLQSVRDALANYRTGVRKNGQAVTLYYDTWPNVDIVPVAQSVNDAKEVTHYLVPDMNKGNWIKSRPKAHSAKVETQSGVCGKNFRRIIKMIKAWNGAHSSYLQSYHIEAMALQIFSTNLDDTPWQVLQFFQNGRTLLDSQLWYDQGYADDYLSYGDRLEAIKRFNTAIDTARLAWFNVFQNNDHKTAIGQWKQIFGDKFPSYG